MEYRARVFVALGDPKYRAACGRGIEFMLAAQYPNGGFPQWWPKTGTIAKRITFNDGVMMGILNVLKDAADGALHFVRLAEPVHARARETVADGADCILKMQIVSQGVRSGWGQ